MEEPGQRWRCDGERVIRLLFNLLYVFGKCSYKYITGWGFGAAWEKAFPLLRIKVSPRFPDTARHGFEGCLWRGVMLFGYIDAQIRSEQTIRIIGFIEYCMIQKSEGGAGITNAQLVQ